MLREVYELKPKNPRTARILKAREPQLIEPPKNTLLLHGPKCPQPLNTVLKTFHALTKPHSILFHKKNENIHPFENAESIEFLANKNECAVVVYGSSNKKRPNCVTVARIFDEKVLDMVEMLLMGTQADMQTSDNAASRESMQKMQLSIGRRLRRSTLRACNTSLWSPRTSPTRAHRQLFIYDGTRSERRRVVKDYLASSLTPWVPSSTSGSAE
ncbi:rRNA-binding ribosome biosynthesis protein rpf2 [Ascosphaera atra]|nr:rRNA-binding ribosome biosynthesis protein rpf2 [Ascosphaera atra]